MKFGESESNILICLSVWKTDTYKEYIYIKDSEEVVRLRKVEKNDKHINFEASTFFFLTSNLLFFVRLLWNGVMRKSPT